MSGLPRPAARGRGGLRAGLHRRRLLAGLPGARPHPGHADRRGPQPAPGPAAGAVARRAEPPGAPALTGSPTRYGSGTGHDQCGPVRAPPVSLLSAWSSSWNCTRNCSPTREAAEAADHGGTHAADRGPPGPGSAGPPPCASCDPRGRRRPARGRGRRPAAGADPARLRHRQHGGPADHAPSPGPGATVPIVSVPGPGRCRPGSARWTWSWRPPPPGAPPELTEALTAASGRRGCRIVAGDHPSSPRSARSAGRSAAALLDMPDEGAAPLWSPVVVPGRPSRLLITARADRRDPAAAVRGRRRQHDEEIGDPLPAQPGPSSTRPRRSRCGSPRPCRRSGPPARSRTRSPPSGCPTWPRCGPAGPTRTPPCRPRPGASSA